MTRDAGFRGSSWSCPQSPCPSGTGQEHAKGRGRWESQTWALLAQEDLQEEAERREQQSERERRKEGWKMERRDKAGRRQDGRREGREREILVTQTKRQGEAGKRCVAGGLREFRPTPKQSDRQPQTSWAQILFSSVSTPSRESQPTHGAPAGIFGKWQSPEAEPAMGRAGAAVAGAIMGELWGPLREPAMQEGGDNRQSLGRGPQECLKQDAQGSLSPALGQTFTLGLPGC